MNIAAMRPINCAEKLAFAKTQCMTCEGTGNNPDIMEFEVSGEYRRFHPCPDCGGTGLAYVLPNTVRIDKQGMWSHRDCKVLERCDLQLDDGTMIPHTTNCRGIGFIALDPVTGGDVWARALWPLLLVLKVEPQTTFWVDVYVTKRVQGDTPAALEAAYTALVTAGTIREEQP